MRAIDLKEKEAAGKGSDKLNSANAQRRADELQARMQKRLAELERRSVFRRVRRLLPVAHW